MWRTFMDSVVMQAFTVLTFIEFANGQTTCNQGMGRVMYERLPNQQLQGFDDDVVRDTAPPFRVLEKCQDLCLRDRSANGLVRTCSSFDFQPGGRIAAFSGTPEYEESTCYLTREQALPEGIGNLMLVPNSVHFTEVCLTSNRPERECPSRRYVFERHPRKKLKLPSADLKEIMASNRTECEDKCLNEFSFVCRSASYDQSLRTCSLSRFTRRTHPELLEDEPNSDYLENTCLNAERRCDGLAIFIKEENKRLGGPFEADIYSNLTLDECQAMCIRAEKYFCRSVEYDESTKQCIISEEDSVSQKDDITASSSPTHHFFDLVCLDNPRGTEYPDNSITSHLFSTGRRADTAFQRYRNSRLGGEYHSEITGRALGECLDECLRQASFACRSAAYSDRHRTCRLSRYSQRDGMRIVYDADYDYYENLMHHMLGPESEQGGSAPGTKPDPGTGHGGTSSWGRPPGGGGDRYPPGYDRYPDDDRYGDRIPDRYPDRHSDRYPDRNPERYPDRNHPPKERYPIGGGRYPYDRYPGYERYPADRYPVSYGDKYGDKFPYDRYPAPDRHPIERYPPQEDNYIDRYPPRRDRYPSDRYPDKGGSHYRPDPYPDRYPDNYHNEIDIYADRGRYPSRYPSSGADRDRYPLDRYPSRRDRYPTSYDRYPSREGQHTVYWTGDRGYDRERDHLGGYDRDRPGYPVAERPGYGAADRPIYNAVDRPGYGAVDRPGYGAVDRPGYGAVDRPGYGAVDRPGYGAVDRPAYGPVDRPGYGAVDRPAYGGGVERPGFGGGYVPDRPPVSGIGGGGGYKRPGGYRGTGAGGGYDQGYRPGGYDAAGGTDHYPPPGIGTSRPLRCDEDTFRQIGSRQRMRKQFVRRFTSAQSLPQCERECIEARDFICRSFNFRDNAVPYGDGARDNCELSDRDTRDMDPTDPSHFDSTGTFDFYERSMSQGSDECLDVSQVCNEDGMEFTLRTPEGFFGRIYTYGFYDRCFFRGNGGSVNALRISGSHGYPECGTQRYGDTMTNIVVVQFSDNVQTGRDKRFNLTCLFRGPGEAVVTSNYIGAGSGSPIPIEYLPAENSLSSKVRLMILYQNRPTTTIAVGDPLTFRLEAQDGYNYATDIFATNVIARDPYSGRSVQLIDRYGCPVDNYVFPELDKGRDGDSLEARFNAFKIPESNFLVFEATVRTCRDGCQPAYCNGGNAGRSEPSFGRRRRREINGTLELLPSNRTSVTIINSTDDSSESHEDEDTETTTEGRHELPEHVREMIEVFESRDELLLQDTTRSAMRAPVVQTSVCLTAGEYHGFLTAIVTLTCLLMTVVVISVYGYRRYWWVMKKNVSVDRNAPSMSPPPRPISGPNPSRLGLFGPGILHKHFAVSGLSRMTEFGSRTPLGAADLQPGCNQPATAINGFDDPSEPIYTDPSLFERSRSLRSLDIRGAGGRNNDRSEI